MQMQLAHLFDFVKVNHETFLVSVLILDALTAKYRLMVRAVEVPDSLAVLKAQLLLDI